MKLLLAASAAGELAVGIAAIIAPAAVLEFLVGATTSGGGLVAARMAGVAVAALGVDWWRKRDRLDAFGLKQVAGGYLLYNLGLGALFLVYAATADRMLPVTWLVAVVHLLFGTAFIAGLSRLAAQRQAR